MLRAFITPHEQMSWVSCVESEKRALWLAGKLFSGWLDNWTATSELHDPAYRTPAALKLILQHEHTAFFSDRLTLSKVTLNALI